MTLHVLISLIFLVMGITSTLGTLTRPRRRQPNIAVMHVLLIVLLVELGWLVFSSYVAAEGDLKQLSQCAIYQRAVKLFYTSVATSWLINALLIVVFLAGLDPCGCFAVDRLVDRIERIKAYEDKHQALSSCGNCFCCCCRSIGTKAATGDLVRVLGQLFGGFDITLANLAVGLRLAAYYQTQLKKHDKSPDEELRKVGVVKVLFSMIIKSKSLLPRPLLIC